MTKATKADRNHELCLGMNIKGTFAPLHAWQQIGMKEHFPHFIFFVTHIFFLYFFRKDRCRKVALGMNCEVGLRRRTYYVLAGSVLSVWSRVEAILNAQPGSLSKMQIIRLRIDDGSKIVGKDLIVSKLKRL